MAMELDGIQAGTPPSVVFLDPDPAWSRFEPTATRLLLVLIEQTLKIGSRELQVLTVRGHHASVLVVADRTPVEIAQVGLPHYDHLKRFLKEGLFRGTEVQRLRALGSSWEMRVEYAETPTGEG
ncbi:MAG TPA: hypothetical protein VEI97_04060, partial [bacterium]|nr:hypothetical protein [bacterium]